MENNNIICKDNSKNEHIEITLNRPKKVFHFSDGIVEEFDEVHVAESQSSNAPEVDPKSLTWGPWFVHYAWISGSKALNAVDYMGEGLAGFFGITTPKYQEAIDEHERLQEEKRKMDEESAGWVPKSTDGNIPLVLSEPAHGVDDKPTSV